MESMLQGFVSDIKAELMRMAGLVETSLTKTLECLKSPQDETFQEIFDLEDQVNDLHRYCDKTLLRLMARQAPMASDLRLVISLLKINGELERMGDLSCNIAYRIREYFKRDSLRVGVDLGPLSESVLWMVQNSIESLRHMNPTLAMDVILRDDQVDEAKDKAYLLSVEQIKQNPNILEPGLDIILISRNLERVADHATNIAEDVIFAKTGRDIRHGTHDEFK